LLIRNLRGDLRLLNFLSSDDCPRHALDSASPAGGEEMRTFVSLLLVIACCVTSAAAQSGDWAAVEGLAPGTDISLKTTRGQKLQGELDSVTTDHLTIWSQERDFPGHKTVRREFSRSDVKQIWVNHRVGSVLAGAAIGTGVGVGIGVAIDAQSRNNEDRSIAGVVFGLLGGAIGAGIAKYHPFLKGKTIYLAP
jgi:hypothetical protein